MMINISEKFRTSEAFFVGGAAAIGLDADIGLPTWDEFASSWDDLLQDRYMGGGGTYRFRRYSEFSIIGGKVEVLEHRAYRQTKDINYLNGGIDRMYEPITPGVREGDIIRNLFRRCEKMMPVPQTGTRWLVQTFQNRIYARPSVVGHPAPEGIHRDGVDYVLTLLVNRSNVEGGESGIYANADDTTLATATMKEPGEFIFLDDNAVRHGVTGISNVSSASQGYRDTLIAMFTRQ
jgi:hypothetical protein